MTARSLTLPSLISALKNLLKRGLTIVQYTLTFPDGLDVEVIKFSALDIAHQKAQLNHMLLSRPLLGI